MYHNEKQYSSNYDNNNNNNDNINDNDNIDKTFFYIVHLPHEDGFLTHYYRLLLS